ncbi:hypothetical protein BHV42_04460 [Candidatus Melainabacteria bacterium MEL.A1]|nr:hypothetical protein BHV42_04460 [Candidatus Melainabacteria bacterium MEL.A1]
MQENVSNSQNVNLLAGFATKNIQKERFLPFFFVVITLLYGGLKMLTYVTKKVSCEIESFQNTLYKYERLKRT